MAPGVPLLVSCPREPTVQQQQQQQQGLVVRLVPPHLSLTRIYSAHPCRVLGKPAICTWFSLRVVRTSS